MAKYGDAGKAAMPLGLSAWGHGHGNFDSLCPRVGLGEGGGGAGGVFIINCRIKRMQEYLLRSVLERVM
jgi:hypothetical protein